MRSVTTARSKFQKDHIPGSNPEARLVFVAQCQGNLPIFPESARIDSTGRRCSIYGRGVPPEPLYYFVGSLPPSPIAQLNCVGDRRLSPYLEYPQIEQLNSHLLIEHLAAV